MHHGVLLDLFNEVEHSYDEPTEADAMPLQPIDPERAPQDARRPSLIEFEESGHDEALQLVQTEEYARRRSSVTSSGIDNLAEMQQASASFSDLAGLEEPITEEE